MEEIKSFKEYIIENGIIEETYGSGKKKNYKPKHTAPEQTQNQPFEKEEKPQVSMEPPKEEEPDEKEEVKSNSPEASSPSTAEPPVTQENQNKKEDQSDFLPTSKPVSLKIDSSLSPIQVRTELRKQYNKIKDTYDNLESLLTAKGFKPPKEDSTGPMNIIGDTSFLMARNEWVNKWEELIAKRRATRQNAEDTETLQKKAITAKQKQERDDAHSRLTDPNNIGNKQESLENKNSVNESVNILEKKKAFLDSLKAIPRAFRTSSELSSGIGNKYASNRVLTTVDQKNDGRIGRLFKKDSEKTGVYGIGGDNNTKFADDMYNKFVKDARAIIAKERPLGLSYLRRADKSLTDYENSAKYIKTSDATRAATISRDLYRAYSNLTSIGYKLKNLVSNYQDSLNKISDEIKIRDTKYTNYLNSTNAQKALENQEKRIQKRAEHSQAAADEITNRGEHAEADSIRKAKDAEEKEIKKGKSDDYNQISELAFKELNRLAKYGESGNYDLSRVINECKKLSDAINQNSKKAGWDTTKNDDGDFIYNMTNQKKAKALALYIFFDNLRWLKENSQSSKFKNFIKTNFDKNWFKKAMKKFDKASPEKIVEFIQKNAGGTLPNDVSKLDKLNDWIYQKRRGIAAKEFDDSEKAEKAEETQQPTSIYDYAIQKAKQMQEN